MTELVDAIERVCRDDSYYWLFRHTRGLKRGDAHEVEVRVDLPADTIANIREVPGWSVARTKPEEGMLFLRRTQPLTNSAMRSMFAEVITFAHGHSGKFHSWMHGADLPDWTEG
jgi:hypothetical protein